MKHFKILLLSLATSASALAVDVNVSSGALAEMVGSLEGQSSLKVSGTIDVRDLAAIELLPASVKTLDLGAAAIEASTMPSRKYFGRTLFNADEIPAYTFFKSGLESVTLPASTESICEGAFAGSSLRNIVIPEGVTSIGDYAFYGCTDLESVTLPSTLKELGKGAFGNCTALRSIDLSSTGLTELPERVLAGASSLSDVILPAGLLKVGREALAHTAITALNMSAVKEFADYALSGMASLNTVALNPAAITGVGLLMDDTALQSLSGMPEAVPDYFAANCSDLEANNLVMNSSAVGRYSFANTTSSSLILPDGLSRLERGALSGMTGLDKIDATSLGGNIPEVEELTFEGLDQPEITLYVDDNYVDAWKAHPQWSLFKIVGLDETGMASLESYPDSGIAISVKGGNVAVRSASTLTDVRIYTADGRLVFASAPGSNEVYVDASTLPSGIVVVSAADSDANRKTLSVFVK